MTIENIKPTLRVAMYCRVSTRDKGQDIKMQKEYLKSYAERENLLIVKEYFDEGVSGAKDSRPAFDIMLSNMRSGLFKGVLVYKLDRIGRSLPHLVKLFEEFSKRGVAFISGSQNIKTDTPEGRMFLNMLMVLAEYERDLTVGRIKDGLAGAINVGKRGKDKGSRRKSGYWLRWAKQTTPQNVGVVPIENVVKKEVVN